MSRSPTAAISAASTACRPRACPGSSARRSSASRRSSGWSGSSPEDSLRPWQHRSWIFPTDPNFLAKARARIHPTLGPETGSRGQRVEHTYERPRDAGGAKPSSACDPRRIRGGAYDRERQVELGGFEPPTSWVRSSPIEGLLSSDPRAEYARICGDVIRVGNFWREVPEIVGTGSRPPNCWRKSPPSLSRSHRAHNPKVAGSNSAPAIEKEPAKQALFCGAPGMGTSSGVQVPCGSDGRNH